MAKERQIPAAATPALTTTAPAWAVAQAIVMVATLALIGALIAVPDVAMRLLWGLLVPLLPLSFLFGTGIWRSVCPLATLNMLPNRWVGRRAVSAAGARLAGVAGIVLLALLVPARRFAFNTSGAAVSGLILAAGAGALLLGFVFEAKAGFCNAVCPVLPVERLYGQYPLLRTGNPRCPSCAACTPGTCIDLAPARSLVRAMGPPIHDGRWARRPLGAFAAAFPGFIVGYYTLVDVPLSEAAGVYAHVFGYAAASYFIVVSFVGLARLHSNVALPLLAAAAAALYYWFAAPAITRALVLPGSAAAAIRVATLVLVGVWLSTALVRSGAVPRGAR